MHKGFIDKNRRFFNLRQMQVENVLPEHFAQYYPKFITLLKKYYEWQETEKSTELINHLFASRDINETDITLLSYIEDELLLGDAYFEGFGDTDLEKRAAANFSNTLFRSKGTKFAIEWFFRSFYGLDAEVIYPKENIFKVSDDQSRLGPASLKYLTDDKLYQTYALLVRVGVPISKWKDVFKLFAHPAGMYLGGEVLITDIANIVTSFPMDDSAVESRTTSSYVLTGNSSVSEGQSIEFTVTGTNVQDNIDAVYYYINHVSTSDSDFPSTFLYDSVNAPFSLSAPGYVGISEVGGQAKGTFTVPLFLDSDESESNELFKVYIKDKNGTIQDSAEITVQNVASTYTLSLDSARSQTIGSTGEAGTSTTILTLKEGDVMNFTITGVPTNPPNQTLEWYVDPIGSSQISSIDFTETPPLIGSPRSIQIENDSARFSLQTIIEKTNSASEPDEYFRVILKSGAIIKDSSDSIFIENVVPTFDVAFASDSVFEGQSLLGTLTIDNFNVGTTINWSLSGDILNDPRLIQSAGSFVASSTSTDFSIPFDKTDSASATGTSGTLNISPVGFTPDPYTTATFTLVDSAATFSINASPAAAAEGDSATFTVSGANIVDGTTVYMYVDYNQTDVNDFVSPPPTIVSRQAITIDGNAGTTDLTLQFASNGDTNETFAVVLSDAATGGNTLATRNFTITAVPYTLDAAPTSVNEGNSVIFTLGATGLADGTYYYRVSGTNITASDFVTNAFFNGTDGQFQVTSGEGTFGITIANDVTFEGTETFTVDVSETLGGTPIVSSEAVTINDTSAPSYTISVADIREGEQVEVIVTPDPGATERLYYEISGAAASKFSFTQTSVVTGSLTNPFTVTIPYTASTDPVYNGSVLGTVSVSRGDYVSNGATAIDTDTFNVIDAVATADLTPDNATPNEGDTVVFTISNSTNLPPTVYYLPTAVKRVKSSTNAASGQNFIALTDTSELQVGMESNSLAIAGTITSVQSNGVFMSQDLLNSLTTGDLSDFAFPEVFDDFDGAPTGSTTISTFSVNTASTATFASNTYTFAIYDAAYGGNQIATADITIQDTGVPISIDVSGLDVPINTPQVSDYETTGITSQAVIEFRPDGNIYAAGNQSPSSNNLVDIGQWIFPAGVVGSNYTVTAVINSGPTGVGQLGGSYGTELNLGTTRSFSLTVSPPSGVTGSNASNMNVTFTVQEVGNSQNSDEVTISYRVEAYDNDGGGDTVEP